MPESQARRPLARLAPRLLEIAEDFLAPMTGQQDPQEQHRETGWSHGVRTVSVIPRAMRASESCDARSSETPAGSMR